MEYLIHPSANRILPSIPSISEDLTWIVTIVLFFLYKCCFIIFLLTILISFRVGVSRKREKAARWPSGQPSGNKIRMKNNPVRILRGFLKNREKIANDADWSWLKIWDDAVLRWNESSGLDLCFSKLPSEIDREIINQVLVLLYCKKRSESSRNKHPKNASRAQLKFDQITKISMS